MTSEPLPTVDPPAASAAQPSAVEVAARLAQRLCHDFMSPTSGIVSGLDLLDDPSAQNLRAEAMELIASSARKLIEALSFARAAFGGGSEPVAAADLEGLARGVFSHLRPDLEWAVEATEIAPIPARVLLNLAQLAGGALASGGVARATVRIEPEWTAVMVDAIGERARLHPEIAAGLRGEPMGEGLGGRWVQAWCLHGLVTAVGGAVAAEVGSEGVAFKAAIPT